MSDTFTAADFTSAEGDTSTQPASSESGATVDTSASPGGATTQPADSATPPISDQGPIPFTVHKTALENARTKARDEALAEWRTQHGWAEQVDRKAIEEAQRVGQLYTQNRVQFLSELITDALGNPESNAAAKSALARHFASLRGQQANPDGDDQPDVPFVDANGQIAGYTYSAQKVQALVKQAVQQTRDEILREVQPLKQDHETRQKEAVLAKIQKQADEGATALLTELRSSPGFKEHEKEIKAAMLADERLSVEAAYRRIVIPKLSQTERQQVVADLRQKTDVNTAHPTRGTTTAPRQVKDMSWKEALEHEYAHRSAGAK